MDEFPSRGTVTTNPAPGLETKNCVLAAINTQEAKWFLRERGNEVGTSSAFSRLVRPGTTLSAVDIMSRNPEVLLSCWSTPSLPEDWLLSTQCRLRYVCHLTGSVRHVLPRAFIERGGLVTNWGAIPAITVAEHALLLALAALRNVGQWRDVLATPPATVHRVERLHTRTLVGRRVGLHGFGKVARALVKLLAPFQVEIVGYSAGVPAQHFIEAGVQPASSLREVFSASEVVFECEALTAQTKESVQGAELAALPVGSVFVNVARAGLVDDAALLREASSGRIRVALDVFSTEPLPADSPWWRVPDAVLSPHIAGPTFDQYDACTLEAMNNLRRYFANEPLHSIVTAEIYDRST
jgi:phosphoglycerate dehydrogenase-like enzyme